MGSSGSGRITDYPGSSKKGSGGDPSPEDRCERAFSAALEDIEHSDYYKSHGAVPPVGERLRVTQRKRLVAETTNGESVGNLPTSLNYLAGCLKDGWGYRGEIRNSKAGRPVATISADFAAIPAP